MMNTEEIKKRYMEKYNELSVRFDELDVSHLVEDLNYAISKSDMSKVNELYNRVLGWNTQVDNLVGAKLALDVQYRYLRLPSPALFGIIYDGEEKTWKFNTSVSE